MTRTTPRNYGLPFLIACMGMVFLSASGAYATDFGAADDYIMMKIGESSVTAGEVKRQWQQLFPEGQAPELDMVQPEMRQNFLRSLMVERVLAEEARKAGIEEDPHVKQALEEARRSVLVREFLAKKSSSAISENALKNAYSRMVAARKNANEIRVRHILVHTEDEARDVREQLAAGSSFDTLAEKYSKDPATAAQGGDLGYMLASDMDKPFAEAAFALKKNAISAPVKTMMGWHIIRVDETRKATIPTFEQARAELTTQLQEQALNGYVEQLIKQAGIVVMDASGEELENRPAAPAKPVSKPAVPAKPVAPKPEVAAPKKPDIADAPKPAENTPANAEQKQEEKTEEKVEEKKVPKFDPNDPKSIPDDYRR